MLKPAPRYFNVSGTSIPTMRSVRLRYSDSVSLGNGVDSPYKYTIRSNSLYDPDYQVGGHQPKGFDFWAGAYKRYLVYGAKLTAYFINIGEVTDTKVWISPSTDLTGSPNVISTWRLATESRGIPKKILRGSGENTTGETKKLTHYMRPTKVGAYVGATTDTMNDYTSDVATNPTRPVYWHIYLQDITDTAIGSGQVLMNFTIDFYAIMYDPDTNFSS